MKGMKMMLDARRRAVIAAALAGDTLLQCEATDGENLGDQKRPWVGFEGRRLVNAPRAD